MVSVTAPVTVESDRDSKVVVAAVGDVVAVLAALNA